MTLVHTARKASNIHDAAGLAELSSAELDQEIARCTALAKVAKTATARQILSDRLRWLKSFRWKAFPASKKALS